MIPERTWRIAAALAAACGIDWGRWARGEAIPRSAAKREPPAARPQREREPEAHDCRLVGNAVCPPVMRAIVEEIRRRG